MQNQGVRVLINGAGVAGLTLASSLVSRGITPTILDASHGIKRKSTEDGILLSPLSMKLIDEIDGGNIGDLVRQRGQLIQTFHVASDAGVSYGKLRFEKFSQRNDLPAPVGIQKWELLDILENFVSKSTRVNYKNTLRQVGVTKSGKLSPTFGRSSNFATPPGNFDVLVGADGPASVVRSTLFNPNEVHLKQLGYMVWSMVVDRPASIDPATATEMWGEGRRLFVYPLSSTQLMLWGTTHQQFNPMMHDQGKLMERSAAAFRDEFAPFFSSGGLHAVWREIDNQSSQSKAFFPPDIQVDRKVLENHPVALIGDAAHCIPPTLLGHGGAGLAIEDAAAVSNALLSDDYAGELQSLSKTTSREKYVLKQARRGDVNDMTEGKLRLALRHMVMKWKYSSYGLNSAWRTLATKR